MTGEQKSKDVNDRLKEYERVLDEYLTGIGVNSFTYNPEVDDILSLTKNHLRGMSPEELGENSYILAQYSAYIQKEYNRQVTRVKWARTDLERIVSALFSEYKTKDEFVKHEVVVGRIMKDNTVAKKLGSIVKFAEGRMSELQGLSQSVNVMSNTLIELQRTKRYRK